MTEPSHYLAGEAAAVAPQSNYSSAKKSEFSMKEAPKGTVEDIAKVEKLIQNSLLVSQRSRQMFNRTDTMNFSGQL